MSRSVWFLMLLSTCLLWPRIVDAQTAAPAVDNRSVFGTDARDPDRLQKADLSMSLTVTDDNRNRLAQRLQGVMLDSWMLRSGRYPALDGTLRYERKTKRLAIGLDTTSTLQYSSRQRETMTDHMGGVTLQVPVGRRTEVSATQRMLYAPRYQSPVLSTLVVNAPASAVLPGMHEAASPRLGAHSATTSVRVSQHLNRRSSAAFSYDFQSVQFSGAEADLRTWGVAGRFTRRLTRYAALHLGYGQRLGRYGSASDQAIQIHDLDLGMDYNRTVSRSMAVSITPGSSVIVTKEGKRFRPSGDIAVSRRFGRSWTTRMLYRRRSEFIEGFGDPFFVDSATAAIAGYVRRGLDVSASASYSTSEIGSLGDTYYDSLSGSAQATFAINRSWAAFAEYLYDNQRIEGALVSAASPLSRHSMRMGLKWRTSLR